MKTKEELAALKEEVENLNKKLAELNDEELKQVTGGFSSDDYNISWNVTPGEDYNDQPTDAGTYNVIIKGNDNYLK